MALDSNIHIDDCPFCRGLHWHKYQYLESKLIDISRHLILDNDNFNAYGESIADLLVLTGNSMDTFFKDMRECPNFKDMKSLWKKKRNNLKITDYQKIYENYYEFSKNDIIMDFELGKAIKIKPFSNFSKTKPTWWDAYNNTKHQFYSDYSVANLGNAVLCLGGLLILNALHLCNSAYLAFTGQIDNRYSNISTHYHTARELVRSKIGVTVWATPYHLYTKVFNFQYRTDESVDVHDPELIDISDYGNKFKKEMNRRNPNYISNVR